MLRQNLKRIESWTEESARGDKTRRLSFVIYEDCHPLAGRIWAEAEMLANPEVGPRWRAQLLMRKLPEGGVQPIQDDFGDTVFVGPTFAAVARDVLLAFEGFVDDHRGAIDRLSSVLDAPVLTVSEVADELRTPRNTVLHWIKTGRLKAFRIGKKWQIRREDLQEALDAAGQSGSTQMG